MNKTHSRTDSAGYLDGIPVKIGEKFKPPRQITLPLNYQQRNPSHLLSDDYNFHLERQIIEWSEGRRRMKEQKERAKDEKVATQIEQFTRLSNASASDSSDASPSSAESRDSSENDNVDNGIPPSTTTTTTSTPVSVALFTNLEKTDILKPQLFDQPNLTHAQGDRPVVNQIKLEDFEAESSPFDSVELKTLNDMEELKSVLQNCVTTTTATTAASNQHYTAATLYNANNSNIPSYLAQYANYSDYSTTESRWNTTPSYYNHQTCSYTAANPTTSSLYGTSQFTSSHQQQQQAITPSSDSSSNSSGSLRNARSTPDILREVGKVSKDEVKKRNSHLVRPSSIGSVIEPSCQSLSDPYDELSDESQTLVNQMVDMGFPRARAARAVQELGGDDKKVVEHLCSVQCLIELGFNAEKAEVALHMNQQDQNQAEEYLNLTKQFLDLGFEEEKIKIALSCHKNDRDKILDYLVS